jgi:hypothetical protein
VDVWEESISDFIYDRKAWRMSEVMEKLQLPVWKRNGLEHRRVCSALDTLGYECVNIREFGWQRGWIKKGTDQAVELPRLDDKDTQEIPF